MVLVLDREEVVRNRREIETRSLEKAVTVIVGQLKARIKSIEDEFGTRLQQRVSQIRDAFAKLYLELEPEDPLRVIGESVVQGIRLTPEYTGDIEQEYRIELDPDYMDMLETAYKNSIIPTGHRMMTITDINSFISENVANPINTGSLRAARQQMMQDVARMTAMESRRKMQTNNEDVVFVS